MMRQAFIQSTQQTVCELTKASGIEVEVTSGQLADWQNVMRAFNRVQGEMRLALEDLKQKG